MSSERWWSRLFNIFTLVALVIGIGVGGLAISFLSKGKEIPSFNDEKDVQRKGLENLYVAKAGDLYTLGGFVSYYEIKDIDVDNDEKQSFDRKTMDYLLKNIATSQIKTGLSSINWDTKIHPIGKSSRTKGGLYLDIESTLSLDSQKDYYIEIKTEKINDVDYRVMKLSAKIVVGWYGEDEKKEDDPVSTDTEYKVLMDHMRKIDFGYGDNWIVNPLHYASKLTNRIGRKETGYVEREVDYRKNDYSGLKNPTDGQIAWTGDDFFGKLSGLLIASTSELQDKLNNFALKTSLFKLNFTLTPIDKAIYFVDDWNHGKIIARVEVWVKIEVELADEKLAVENLTTHSGSFIVSFDEK